MTTNDPDWVDVRVEGHKYRVDLRGFPLAGVYRMDKKPVFLGGVTLHCRHAEDALVAGLRLVVDDWRKVRG